MVYSLKNEMAMENVAIITAMESSKDRIAVRKALESEKPEDVAKIVSLMYAEIQSKINGYDTKEIDASAGNFLKIKGYETTAKAVEAINKVLNEKDHECVALMNDMHDMIVSCRADFEHGYRYSVDFIKMLYVTMVLDLYELIDMCICIYTDSLKTGKFNKTKKKFDNAITGSTKKILGCYRSGEWGKMMKLAKDPKVAQMSAVKESLAPEVANEELGALAIIGILAAVPIAIRALIAAIRAATAFFFRKAASLAQYLETQSEFLQAAIDAEEKLGQDPKAVEKQKKALDVMQNISGFIEAKIMKTDMQAKKDLAEANRNTFKPVATNVSAGTAGDFAIL